MRALTWVAGSVAVSATLLLGACSGAPDRLGGRATSEAAVVYGNGSSSISGAGQAGWTTPPAGGSVQPAPVPVTSTWSAPPSPAAPAGPTVVEATPYSPRTPVYSTQPCPPAPCPPAPAAAPARVWSGCRLPCADGLSQWHVRGVIGYAFYEGDDAADSCLYWGADVGRTFCGCWGLDVFYRYHSGQFDRINSAITKDGGSWNHVGVKATYESSIGGGRFYWWVGVGPEYFWTDDYLVDDDGFGVFGEAGVGYLISRNLRVRAGVNVHGMDTNTGRRDPANDGDSRWLWVLAPVLEVELDF